MCITGVKQAIYHECVEFTAKIRSFPKHTQLVWMKDTIPINLKEPKYMGSTCQGDNPVLCINKVTKEDEAVYSIEAENEFGKGRCCSEKLEVIGGKWILNNQF